MAFALYLLANVCVAALFKLFPRHRVDVFHAIVINYSVCFLMGFLLNPDKKNLTTSEILDSAWFKFDIGLGIIFILGFTTVAHAIITAGITLTTMMQKMSILVTVTCSVLFFSEPFGIWQGIGLCLAVAAIIAINQRPEQGPKQKNFILLLAVLLFSAAIELILLYVDRKQIVVDEHFLFTSYGFGFAALVGWIMIGYKWFKERKPIHRQDWIGGVLLGLPNFLTIYLLLVMLRKGWNGSVLYPILNVTVLTVITITAWLVFKEKLRLINWAGIGLAIAAILMIGLLQP